MSFDILHRSPRSKARLGVLHTVHGDIQTPAFMPIGTKAAVKTLSSDEVKALGAEVILSNTYHLWLNPGDEIIAKAGGLHKFMNWPGPIMTDSGGFQLFSLGEKRNPSRPPLTLRGGAENAPPLEARGGRGALVTEEGVTFRDTIFGDSHLLTPEKSVQIQANLGSDITVVLDEFTGDINNYEKVKSTVERTTRWATRARTAHQVIGNKLSYDNLLPIQLQYAVVQGGMFEDLRMQSVKELRELDFEGYCIGGVAVGGETSQEQYKAVDMSVPYLPEARPRHLLGVGTPEQIIESVKHGIDTFDCVIPTREARHGKIYLVVEPLSSGFSGSTTYQTIDINKAIYREDFEKLDPTCDCEACTKYSKAYLHHLFKSGEILGLRLLTMHNVRFYLKLMEQIRSDIRNDS